LNPECWGYPLLQEKCQEEKDCDKRQQQHTVVVVVVVVVVVNRWRYSPMQTFTSLKDISQSALFFDLSFQFAILYFYTLNNTNIFGEFESMCKLFPLTGMSRQSHRMSSWEYKP